MLLALLAAGAAFLAAAAHAESAGSLRAHARRLEAANASLDEASRRALLDLYALDAKLRRAGQRLAALETQARRAAEEEWRAQRALELARRSHAHAEEALLARARALYVEGEPDPLSVILDASSLDDLLSAIDSVNRLADEDRRIIEQLEQAQRSLTASIGALEARRAELARLTQAARTAQASLAAARSDKLRYLRSLERRKAFNARTIAALLRAAAAADAKAQQLAPAPASAAGAPQPPAGPAPATPQPVSTAVGGPSGRRVTVSATMYCLRGSTATGIPVGPGVVATDPAYIPLGTRMYIPGYGRGVAADTGSAVVGWTIDLWVASCSRARAFGRQTLTITLLD